MTSTYMLDCIADAFGLTLSSKRHIAVCFELIGCTTKLHHVSACLQSIDREAALAQFFKPYFELDRERPFFEVLGEFRSHIAKCEEHVATAMSEVSPLHHANLLELNPASIL